MSTTNKMDVNQIFKAAFSAADGALKTVPGAATSFSVELDANDGDSVATRSMAVDTVTLLSAVPASVDVNSTEINTLNYRTVGLVVSASALTGVLNATVTVQMSLDNIIWVDTATTGTLDSANKALNLSVSDFPGKFIRIRYVCSGVLGGTITAKYVLKG